MVRFNSSAPVALAAILLYLGAGWSSGRTPGAPPEPNPSPAPKGQEQPAPKSPVMTPPTPPPGAGSEPAAGAGDGQPRAVNFVVEAPTDELARALTTDAELHRRALALKWLGQELPAWSKPCPIRYAQGLGNNGATTFHFDKNASGEPVLKSLAMELRGEFKSTRAAVLPHEVMHAILASYFGKPVPRWADEGIACLAEPDEQQANQDRRAREFLNGGRGIRLKVLLPMTGYPRDVLALYAQGHSVARYLAGGAPSGTTELKDLPHVGTLFADGADGHRRLLAFVYLGAEGNTAESWAKAAKTVYGFKSLDDLEEAWLAWLTRPESFVKPTADCTPEPPNKKPEGGSNGDFIPLARLPVAPPGKATAPEPHPAPIAKAR
jgi:hypothetical protein